MLSKVILIQTSSSNNESNFIIIFFLFPSFPCIPKVIFSSYVFCLVNFSITFFLLPFSKREVIDQQNKTFYPQNPKPHFKQDQKHKKKIAVADSILQIITYSFHFPNFQPISSCDQNTWKKIRSAEASYCFFMCCFSISVMEAVSSRFYMFYPSIRSSCDSFIIIENIRDV